MGILREAFGRKREKRRPMWRARKIGFGLLEAKLLGNIPVVGKFFRLHGAYKVGRGVLNI